MRLYAGKIPVIAGEIVKALVDGEDLSVLDRGETELDVQAVLKEYLRLEREVTEKAKDLLQKRNLPYEHFGKIKRQMRKRMTDILKKHMQIDDEIDAEVRRRIKNLEEGTATWEVEYQKALDQIKKNRRLDE